MRRGLSSFKMTTFESLQKLAKLDSLNLENNRQGEKVLSKYENFLSTHSQSMFIPKCLYSKIIESKGDFSFESHDPSDLKLKLSSLKNENSLIDEILYLMMPNTSFEMEDIKKTFLHRIYPKNYSPMELKSSKLTSVHFKLEPQIEEVCKNISTLKLSEWNQIIENMIFIYSIYKNIKFLKLDVSVLKDRESQIIQIVKNSDILETSKFINLLQIIMPQYQLPPEVFEHLKGSITSLNHLEDNELLQVLLAYPEDTKNDEINEHLKKLIMKYDWIPYSDLLNLIIKMAKLKLKIPCEALYKIERNFDLIDKNDTGKSIECLRPLFELKLVTKLSLQFICESIIKLHSSESNTQPVLYDLYSILYETGNLYLILDNDSILYNIFQISPFLPIEKLLKVLIGLIHHIKDFNLLESYIERLEHTDLSTTKVSQPLLEKLLTEIFLFSEESPIFQYQFTSYKIVEHNQLKKLAKALKNILTQVDQSSPLVYRYYNSNLSDEEPPENIINTVKFNKKEWAKLLWRLKDTHNLKDKAEMGLENIDYNNIDPEYLYYLSSITKINININKLPDSDYTLAIMYNTDQVPKKYKKKVKFINLVTEAQVKTIIMLQRLKEYSQINKATEFLGFMPMAQPEIPSFVIKDLISSLSSVDKSCVNYYAVSCLINRFTKILTKEDFLELDKFFYGNTKTIHHELEDKMSLIKVENIYEREKHLNSCKFFIDQAKNRKSIKDLVYELKKLLEMKFLFKSSILSVMRNKKFGNSFESLSKMILEIMAETQPDEDILKELVKWIEDKQLWNNLDFEAQCNFFLISTKAQVLFPNIFKDNFLSTIYSRNESESLSINPKNGLSYYKSFKYTTILEPRYLISNDIHTKATLAEFSDRPEIPQDLVINNVKALSYLNHLKLQRTSELEESIRLYYRKKNENNHFYNNKLSIFEDLSQIFKENEIQENFTEPKTYWIVDFWIQSRNLAINILCENDFYIDEKLNTKLSLFQEVVDSQLKNIAGLKVLTIDFKQWKEFSQSEKENFIQEKSQENR